MDCERSRERQLPAVESFHQLPGHDTKTQGRPEWITKTVSISGESVVRLILSVGWVKPKCIQGKDFP